MPIQVDFILRQLGEMTHDDPELRGHQPWKAAYEHHPGWLSNVITEHYAGNDTNVRTLTPGYLAAFTGITVEDFEASDSTRSDHGTRELAISAIPGR